MIKKIIQDTEPEVLISNLRAEVGDLIDSWILYRHFKVQSSQLQTNDIIADSNNKELNFLYVVTSKFKDDIIARLAELGDQKVGQLTFHFAYRKFKALEADVNKYENFIKTNKFTDNRNNFISHKNLKPTWEEKKAPHRIDYRTITVALAMAIALMKKFDELYYGTRIKQQWKLIRKTRYEFTISRRAEYMLMPHILKPS
ncbi:hypothetical protein ACYE2N_01610 [Flavobacterium sp. MAHUQ-51]|uniref:hypothetical protein n=1 Tax=Flavobacterium sp. GCM10022190 TaxID=3252639 RepID=UPI0036165573